MRLLQGWKVSAAWTVFGFLIVGTSTVIFLRQPELAILGCVGIVAIVLVVCWPALAVIGIVATDGLAMVFLILGVDSSVTGYGSFILLVFGAFSAMLRATGKLRTMYAVVLLLVVFLLTYGILAAGGSLGAEQVVGGVRLVSSPILSGLIGLSMGRSDAVRLLRFGTVIVVGSFIAAFAEKSLGVASLIAYGLEAGTTVRTFDGVLRAPGLFATNYSMGAFAGVMGALALLWWPVVEPHRRAVAWRVIAVAASAGCLYMSIYRTGILVLAVAIAAWVLFARGRGSAFRKIAIVGTAIYGLYLFFRSGFGSNSSFLERLTVWDNVIATSPPNMLGYGLGYSGAASSSRFADLQITVDNYYLSLILQFGILSILLILPLGAIALLMTVRSSSTPMLRSGMVLLGCMVAFWFVDYWEYVSAMSLAICAVGIACRTLVPVAWVASPKQDDYPVLRSLRVCN